MVNTTDIELPPLPFDDFSQYQIKSVAIVSKFSGLLSLWGSSFIIYDILGTKESRDEHLKKAYYRIMLGLSVSDCMISFSAWFLSTWALPRDYVHDKIVWGNIGNWGTCQAQGFMVHFGGFASAFYTAMLTLHFLLYIKYRWTEEDFRRIEPFLHGAIWTGALVSATIPLFNDLYNPEMMFCWVQSYPYGCEFSEGFECIFGQNLSTYLWSLFFIPVIVCFIMITSFLGLLVQFTRLQEKRIHRLSTTSMADSAEERSVTKVVYKRAIKYVFSFILIWLPEAAFLVSMHFIHIQHTNFMFALLILMGLFSPLQGLFNAMIYTHSNLYSFTKKSIALFQPTILNVPKRSQDRRGSSELP